MRPSLFLVVVLAIVEPLHAALHLTTIGDTGQYRLFKAISALPTGTAEALDAAPISVVAFQNAAGKNKFFVVDSQNECYVADDTNGQDLSELAPQQCPTYVAGQASALGGEIYLVDSTIPGNVWTMHADGSAEATAFSVPSLPVGITSNHQTGRLYLSTADGIYEVDPKSKEPGKLISHVPEGFIWSGITFSADYQMIFASTMSTTSEAEHDSVYGFVLNQGQAVEISHSPDMLGALGVLAGTGCLAEYLFVLTNAGLAQIDFQGVDQLVLSNDDPNFVARGFLSYDPVDGSMLIPSDDGVYRLTPPPCGGFASTPRFRAHALPTGHLCAVHVDCSSNNCDAGQCVANQYLGDCQQDSDCEDSVTPDGFFCQAATAHTDTKKDKKRRDTDIDYRRRSQYGVCEINICANNNGGCHANATCTPTGDAQRVCQCNTGYFGTGLPGRCANPCDQGPCDPLARCVPLTATTARCECPTSTHFGAGTVALPCLASPCALDEDGKNACGAGTCTPLTVTEYDCRCGVGQFRQQPPLDASPYTSEYPQCVADRCSVNNGDCPRNALCTPTGMGARTCACAPGFLPQGVIDPDVCNPATCASLSPGVFPLDAYASVGSCVARVAGQKCQLGCRAGYKPMVNGKSFASISAQCMVRPITGAVIYTFTPYDCVVDPRAPGLPVGAGSDNRDKHDNGDNKKNNGGTIGARAPWYCGVSPTIPCAPSAAWVVSKDTINRRLVLNWVALGTSTGGDVVSELTVHITPDGNPANGFSTPKILEPMFAKSVTIDNLLPGHTYVFRLVAVTQNGVANGLPLEIVF